MMADWRLLSQSITTDKAVNDLPDATARLLFTWCIPFLDRDGRMPGDPAFVRSTVFPRREISLEEIAEYLSAMHDLGLVVWYEVDGEHYLFFPGFHKNQPGLRYDREEESKCPPPPGYEDVYHGRQKRAGIVYIMRAETGAYKIGMTIRNVQQRLHQLRTGSPVDISLIWHAKVEDADGVERLLHRRFDDQRIRGEWFDLTEGDLEWVRENIK
jgi:hypothetical protein